MSAINELQKIFSRQILPNIAVSDAINFQRVGFGCGRHQIKRKSRPIISYLGILGWRLDTTTQKQ